MAHPPLEFEMFCRAEYPQLVGAVGLLCQDRHLAEELAQETLIRAFKQWDRVRCLERPGAWAQRVAFNLAVSQLRRRRLQRVLEVTRRSGEDTHSFDDASAERIVLTQALAALPLRQRAVVVLRYFLDLSASDAAEVLGIRVGSARVLTHRALRSLREGHGIDVAAPPGATSGLDEEAQAEPNKETSDAP